MTCLQHAKKNIAKHSKKWRYGNQTSILQNFMDWTAFVRSDELFHCLWERELDKLSKVNVNGMPHCEDRMINYLKRVHLLPQSDGLLRARWSSGGTQGGYSTYASNAIESVFNLLDKYQSKGEELQDVMEVFEQVQRYLRSQFDTTFKGLFHTPKGPNFPPKQLMIGDGVKAVKGGLHDCQFRRLTVEKMMNLGEQEWYLVDASMILCVCVCDQ